MTLNQTADQLYNLALGGFFNREKFTADGWRRHVQMLMRQPETLKIPNMLVQEIALSDDWHMCAIRYYPEYGEYDFYIPDTREEEQHLIDQLLA